MRHSRPCSVIKTLLLLALLWVGACAHAAQVAGTVTNLSGPLVAKKPDGTAKILARKSEVEEGDTLVTEKNTYAQIKFIDNSEMTLRPGTAFKIEKFSFDSGKPDTDSASFSLLKGGLRSVTGLLGKRSKERFALKTPTGTIGIRGTTFIVFFVEPDPEAALASLRAHSGYHLASTAALAPSMLASRSDAPAMVAPVAPLMLAQASPPTTGEAPVLPPGVYVQVVAGEVSLKNDGGSANFTEGQVGYTASFTQPPVSLPANPGIPFSEPPSFSAPPTASGAPAGSQDGANCIVR